MPSLDDSVAWVSPRADPLTYPGATVDADYLWLDSWMYEILPPSAVARPQAGTLGRWMVLVDGGPLVAPPTRRSSLDQALASAGAAPMNARRPVMSYGSNAAPAQLRAKLAGLAAASRAVPVTRAVVTGFGLGHSPHVSDPGYLPYVLVDNGVLARLPVFVLWLDAVQLPVMNRTEPNYELVTVPADRYPLTLATGETVTGYTAYKGKWGALRQPDAKLPVRAGSQSAVFAGLNQAEWFRSLVGDGDLRAQMGRLRADRSLRDRVRIELAAGGMVAADGWTPGH